MLFSTILQASAALAAIQLEFSNTRPSVDDELFRRFARRAVYSSDMVGELTPQLTSAYNFYHATMYVGTPAQEVSVLLDTGSPVSWLFGPNTTYEESKQFFPNESSTYKDANQSFSAQYGSGYYLGRWGSDAFSVNGTSLTQNSTDSAGTELATADDYLFGVVSNFATGAGAPGLLGLGPHIAGAGPTGYTNFPTSLYLQNVTESPAFSVYFTNDTGKLIFGGLDLAHIQYPIYEYDIVQNSATYGGFYSIPFTSIGLNGNKTAVETPCLLDTGSPMSLVPASFAKQVGQKYNLTYNSTYGTYYTEGDYTNLEGWVNFQLGHFSIDIAISELFIPGEYIWGTDGPQNVSALALLGSRKYVLGDAFFRSVYTVFDSYNKKVYLSRRRETTSDESDVVIIDNINAVPGVGSSSSASASASASGSASASATGSGSKATSSKTSASLFFNSIRKASAASASAASEAATSVVVTTSYTTTATSVTEVEVTEYLTVTSTAPLLVNLYEGPQVTGYIKAYTGESAVIYATASASADSIIADTSTPTTNTSMTSSSYSIASTASHISSSASASTTESAVANNGKLVVPSLFLAIIGMLM